MSYVSRICPQCGDSTPVESRHCAHCGYDTQAGLPMQAALNLPMTLGKAALPVVAGIASLILRAGWKLLRNRLTQDAINYRASKAASSLVQATKNSPDLAPKNDIAPKAKRTVRIRSTWMVGDANGIRQQGSSDHTIEFD